MPPLGPRPVQIVRLEEQLTIEKKVRQGAQSLLRLLEGAPRAQADVGRRDQLEMQLKAVEAKIGTLNRQLAGAKSNSASHASSQTPRLCDRLIYLPALAHTGGGCTPPLAVSYQGAAGGLRPPTADSSGGSPSPSSASSALRTPGGGKRGTAAAIPAFEFDPIKGIPATFEEFINTFRNETTPAHIKQDALGRCALALKTLNALERIVPIDRLARAYVRSVQGCPFCACARRDLTTAGRDWGGGSATALSGCW